METREKASNCNAVVFLQGPLHCAHCNNPSYALCADGECLDLGYVFTSFQDATMKAKEFTARYVHDAIVTTLDDNPSIWVILVAAPCIYELIEATKTPFDHVNSPYHYIGTFSSISAPAPFDETFEYFKRILPPSSLPLMVHMVDTHPFWSIAEPNPYVLEDWERDDAA